MGRHANNHTAFVCIKTTYDYDELDTIASGETPTTSTRIPYLADHLVSDNNNDDLTDSNRPRLRRRRRRRRRKEDSQSFVLPVELEVSQNEALFSPTHTIDFGPISVNQKNNSTGDDLFFSYCRSAAPVMQPPLAAASPFPNQPNNPTSFSFRTFDLYLTNSASLPLQITVNTDYSLVFFFNLNN